jgi:1-pyrroline-5-carboxylate dehydrogenase
MAVPEFVNEPLTDFTQPENRQAFQAALERVGRELGRDWPLVIGGERVTTGEWIVSRNPSQKEQVVGRVAKAGRAEADRALEAAECAFAGWSRFPGEERARVLLRAAGLMRRRRHELSATMVLEDGKTWPEADGDTAEAIDFLEFYAREMTRLSGPQPVQTMRGTDSELVYIPLGVGVSIPPWNFPLAITTGITVSAAVTGNAVILKPASLTPVIAAKLVDLLEEAGMPPGVVNFLPGPGGEVGDYLVAHPRIRFISFTGSMEVGIRIWEEAAKVRPGQRWLKRVVAEMGGKDAIVVDGSADLEQAAAGVVASAYGFQGQKCSACSRVIAVERVYDELLDRVCRLTEQLKVGPALDPETQVGPVASEDQFRKVMEYVEVGCGEGRLALGGKGDDRTGYFVEPTIIADASPSCRVATEEIFGPVLTLVRAPDYDAALAIANDTVYGLTGGVFARDAAKLLKARRELQVGNLYLNRKITGAFVGVEPFGGFNMSGTDSKAGGPDYLQLFMQAKVTSEKL